MSRKHYFPYRVSERPAWFHNLATQLLVVNPVLGVDTVKLNARVADACGGGHGGHAAGGGGERAGSGGRAGARGARAMPCLA
ncbi:MAG TPA: hypothetical protein PK490_10865 [Prosthecobacter sp.]|nr:hypothetical protein [Prosthecobacter sp.]